MKIYNMSVGTPDFKTPGIHQKGCSEAAMDDNNWKSLRDLPELLQAVCTYYKKRFDVELTPDMVMTVYGSQEGMGHLGMAPPVTKEIPSFFRTRASGICKEEA